MWELFLTGLCNFSRWVKLLHELTPPLVKKGTNDSRRRKVNVVFKNDLIGIHSMRECGF